MPLPFGSNPDHPLTDHPVIRAERLVCRNECLGRTSSIPAIPGIYAWYFDLVPSLVPLEGCHTVDGWTLLYVGISPKGDPCNGAPPSRQTLRSRIAQHFSGNAEGSTLRRTLGILLADATRFPLRRVGSGRRMTFTHPGEQALDRWLEEHARVCWFHDPQPWLAEEELIQGLSLPLNLLGNDHHPFFPTLRDLRKQAIAVARSLPIVSEVGQPRRIRT